MKKDKTECDMEMNLDSISCTAMQPKNEPAKLPKLEHSTPQILGTVPLSIPSTTFIMPPLFATAPGMNMIQIDGNNQNTNLPLPMMDSNNSNKRKRKMRECNELPTNKRQKISHNRRMTRSMTKKMAASKCLNSPSVSMEIETSESEEEDLYQFDEDTDDDSPDPS